ncbi:hypothetical protein EYF80_053648 [Liparis tanakae]|uniref:Uncharacterized protein n=1 Tax=Liparis tanakae TaxID=230148 RepID=A0A4Z2F4V7_9TELE|nr:hypothetical protein EYF80_053648 [Liparis tanakae]
MTLHREDEFEDPESEGLAKDVPPSSAPQPANEGLKKGVTCGPGRRTGSENRVGVRGPRKRRLRRGLRALQKIRKESQNQ